MTITFTGDKALDRKFAGMPERLQKKALRKATRETAKFSRSLAVEMAPEDTGQLVRSLKVRATKRSRRLPHTVGTAVETQEGLFRGDTYYAGFLEFGTDQRKTATGAGRGRIEGTKFSFLRPALYAYPSRKLAMFLAAVQKWMTTERVA